MKLTALLLLVLLYLPTATTCPSDIHPLVCNQHNQLIEEPYRHVSPYNFKVKRSLYVS